MLQKFYADTLGSRFIKSLLAQTPIPHFECANDGDVLIPGQYYFKSGRVVKATDSITVVDHGPALENDKQLFGVFRSSTNYYDSETHYALGKYLRYIKQTTDINLLPFYNCFGGEYFSDFYLDASCNVVAKNNSEYRLIAIPIRYNHTYTIAIDCPTTVVFYPCIHDHIAVKQLTSDLGSLVSFLNAKTKVHTGLQFIHPVSIQIKSPKNLAQSQLAIQYEDQLYLAIQVPSSCDSSIVVLEDIPSSSVSRNLSLVQVNTHESYAFSPRLLEYLLNNVITSRDTYHKNISRVQTALIASGTTVANSYADSLAQGVYKKGYYDDQIPILIDSLISLNSSTVKIVDNNLDVNKDVEALLASKGVYR